MNSNNKFIFEKSFSKFVKILNSYHEIGAEKSMFQNRFTFQFVPSNERQFMINLPKNKKQEGFGKMREM